MARVDPPGAALDILILRRPQRQRGAPAEYALNGRFQVRRRIGKGPQGRDFMCWCDDLF